MTWAALLMWLLPGIARAYQADLVPVGLGPETEDLVAAIIIAGEEGLVEVTVEGVSNAAGEPLDGLVQVQLRLRLNGARRRLVIPVPVESGEGDATTSLGLGADDRVVVRDVRLRVPGGRTLALAGLVAADVPPPPPAECPAALAACETELTTCQGELESCEEGGP